MSTHPRSSRLLTVLLVSGAITPLALASPASAAPVHPALTASTITPFNTPNLEPLDIAVVPDGNHPAAGTPYFTATTQGSLGLGNLQIGQIDEAEQLQTYAKGLIQPAHLGQSELGPITVGPDGNLWFTQPAGTSTQEEGVIYRMTPGGAISHQRGVGILSDPSSITAGPGDKLWFTENSDEVGSITTHGAVSAPISTGNGSENIPGSMVSVDGNLWITETNTGQIAEVTPSGIVHQYQVTDPDSEPGPTYIAVGPGPKPDLFYVAGDSIGWMSTNGGDRGVTSLAGSAYQGFPHQLVTAPDGNLWFTVSGAAQLGELTATGQLLPPVTQGVTGDTSGIAANSTELWFTEPANEQVAEVAFTA
jgi:virginiamycin B lyase